jgi:hypothetical protein
MPAIQKTLSFNLVLVAATLAVLPANLARADDASDLAGAYGISNDEDTGAIETPVAAEQPKDRYSSHEFGLTGSAIGSTGDISGPARGAIAMDYVYRYHRDGAIAPGDLNEGNDDLKLTTQFGATSSVDGSRRKVGGVKIEGGRGWLALGMTGISSDSQRVRYLSPQIGPRLHFNDGKSYVSILANPIGGQMSSNTGMHVARTGADVELHHAFEDQIVLDAAGGLGMLYGNGSGSGNTANASVALTLYTAKPGETGAFVTAAATVDHNNYPRRDEADTAHESGTTVTGTLSVGIAR